MTDRLIAALPAMVRPALADRLPAWLDARWFSTPHEAIAIGPGAQIGWFDMRNTADMAQAILNARDMRWLNSIYAGVEAMPLQALHERKVVLTNGAGINAITIAEYTIMGMLTIAKGYREVVRAQERHEWLADSPGKFELSGSKALILGYGAIGKLVHQRLKAFDVQVTTVRRSADAAANVLGPNQWRARLDEYDWIIVAVPATAQTRHLIGVAELAAMKTTAVLLNVARGSVIDQLALVASLTDGKIGAAFLDVTEPEPLPADHPLWRLPNAHITMHLSGNAQTQMVPRAAQRFLDNLDRFRAGEPLHHSVDLQQGY